MSAHMRTNIHTYIALPQEASIKIFKHLLVIGHPGTPLSLVGFIATDTYKQLCRTSIRIRLDPRGGSIA